MILADYKYKSAYFVSFANRYAIDEMLLGKRIHICYSPDCYLSIVFPSISVSNGFPELVMPHALKLYGADIKNWGTIKSYQSLKVLFPVDAWLSAILVECHSNCKDSLPASFEVQQLSKKVLHALQIIAPDAIRISSEIIEDSICDVSLSVFRTEKGKYQPGVTISSMIDDSTQKLFFSDIKEGIRNYKRTISAPFEMLDNARINLSRKDTRAAILNCATSVEVMLKRRINSYLVMNSVPDALKEYVLKHTDGYTKLVDCCKLLSIALSGIKDIQKLVIDVRNRVAHGGYNPSYQEASKAYRSTREALVLSNVPMFE